MQSRGLEGVVAVRSAICQVDGERGVLRYRGYSVPELARTQRFEAVTAPLWGGGRGVRPPRASPVPDLPGTRRLGAVAPLLGEGKLRLPAEPMRADLARA